MNPDTRLTFSWNLLRYSYGLVLVVIGLDKLLGTDLVVHWPKYISPFVLGLLPVSVPVFLAAMGVIEIVVGIMLITKWPRIAGYLSVAWLLLVALNLFMGGFIDIAVRDILLAIGAFVLTELTIAIQQLRVLRPANA